jgi:sulfur-oxidizing protein SoxY
MPSKPELRGKEPPPQPSPARGGGRDPHSGRVGAGLAPADGSEGQSPSRRRILLVAAGVGFASFIPKAGATEAAMVEAIRGLIGESEPQQGKVKLELPPIVENGNTVPLAVSVDNPMTEADHVESIHIFNQKNPQPYVAAFKLGSRTGNARVATRIRLADSQRVVAIARLSDGSYWSDSVDVIVTLAACTEQ